MRFYILILFVGIFISMKALADAGGAGTTSANFLKIPADARPAAMGEAFSALSDDESSLIYNPAGSAGVLQNEISATHIEWFQGIRLEHFGGIFPIGSLGTLGASLDWLQVDQLIQTERIANTSNPQANFKQIGTFDPYDAALTLSYSRILRQALYVGANVRVVQQNITDHNGYGLGLDLGTRWLEPIKDVDLGLVAKNIGTSVAIGSTASQQPLDLSGGIYYHPHWWTGALTVDFGLPIDNVFAWGIGGEYWFYQVLALRAGFHGGWENQFTAGVGIRLEGFSIDYAWVPNPDLGQTHRITASYSFGAPSLDLGLEKSLIGPVGNEDQHKTAWLPHLQQPDKIESWTFTITESTGTQVLMRKGEGPPPAQLQWDGRNSSGQVLPDQKVASTLEVHYADGIAARTKGPEVELDSTPPHLTFDVNPKIHRPNGMAVLVPAKFSLGANDKHGVGFWSLDIKSSSGEMIRAYAGKGTPPTEVIWDGNGNSGNAIQSGQVYLATFAASDTLGNRIQSEPLAQVILFKEVHFAMASDALFEPGKANVRMDAFQQLKEMKEKILRYMTEGTAVEIVGNTDGVSVKNSSYGSNQELSQARADAVVKFFVTLLGMDEKLFRAIGHGDSKPVASNDTPEGRAENRRVEIILRGMAYE